jgi:hypothetical protein
LEVQKQQKQLQLQKQLQQQKQLQLQILLQLQLQLQPQPQLQLQLQLQVIFIFLKHLGLEQTRLGLQCPPDGGELTDTDYGLLGRVKGNNVAKFHCLILFCDHFSKKGIMFQTDVSISARLTTS